MFTVTLDRKQPNFSTYDYTFQRFLKEPLTWLLLNDFSSDQTELLMWQEDETGRKVVQKAFKEQHNIDLKPYYLTKTVVVLTITFKDEADEAEFILQKSIDI